LNQGQVIVFQWDITQSRSAHDQYTVQSHSWKTYLYVPHCPQSSDPVKTVSQNTTQWRIGAAYRAGNYIINPGESYALYWSLEDKYENTPVRLSHDSQDERDKLLSEWVIWCPEQSPNVTKTSEPAKEPDLSKKPEPTHERQRHHKIVFGMDVGTAYSVVSFLGPNDSTPQSVRNWPDGDVYDNRIRSCMSYKDGEFCSYGIQPPDDEGWESGYIKEFKRQIHRLQTNSVSQLKRELLPAGVSLESVYQHWIQYIFNHAKKEYEQHHQIPPDAWLERELIFTIPNGWATPEETLIRAAILGAKCVENEENIHFVSESDAVLHFMLVQSPSELKDSRELIVCDAGASTIDIALYRIIKVDPLEISETKNTPSISIEADLSSVLEEPLISTSGLMVGDSKDVEEPGHDSTRDSPLDAEIEKIIKRIDQLKKGHDPKRAVFVETPEYITSYLTVMIRVWMNLMCRTV